MRRKAESSLEDTKAQLHAEISARVKVSSNTQHANEKNLQLDKQVGGSTRSLVQLSGQCVEE